MNSLQTARLQGAQVFLAPMAGINDPVFRLICKRMGADLTYSEMISAKGLEYNNQKTFDLLYVLDEEKPLAVQLFGNDPVALSEQAKMLEYRYGDALALIDINMGCPARKIASKGEGAALMKDVRLAGQILRMVVEAVRLPVSVKFRKGYGSGEDTAVDFARLAESCGVAQLAVHGRYACQQFHGTSDRELIYRIKQAVSIPVIASGDVFSRADIQQYITDYHADAVMVARGALGNPWIFANRIPALEERVATAREHTEVLAALMPHRLPSMRKHIAWYFKGTSHATSIRRAAQACVSLSDYTRLFDQMLSRQEVLRP